MRQRFSWDNATLFPSSPHAANEACRPQRSGEFEPISWDEALTIATDWLAPVREKDPKKLAFLLGVTSLRLSRVGGHSNLVPQILPHMVAFALLTWPLAAFIPLAALSGNLARLIGT